MSFILTLHSSDCSLQNKLDQPIHLKSNYEVALTDLSFNVKPLINYGKLILESKDSFNLSLQIDRIEVQIILEDNLLTENFVIKVNRLLVNRIQYTIWRVINNAYNVSFQEFLFKYSISDNGKIIYLHNNQIYPRKYDGYDIIEIQGYIKNIFILNQLGTTKSFLDYKFEQDAYYRTETYKLIRKPISYMLPKQMHVIHNIIVYCNFTNSMYYGDKKLNILSRFPIQYKYENIKINFSNPIYVDVKDTILNTININFCDENYNNLLCNNFSNDILLILHFKPKN